MSKSIITVFALVGMLLVISTGMASAAFTAYNDCAGTSSGNVTSYGLTPSQSNTSGLLKDYASNADTSVTVYAATGPGGDGNSYPQPATGVPDLTGTDAGNAFTGKVDLMGVQQYGSTGWYNTLTFAGLNANAKYKFVTTAVRDGLGQGSDYTGRITKFSIIGADSFLNTSSAGIGDLGASTTFCTGENRVGYVASWTEIMSGADGSITFKAEAGGSIRQAYGFSAFMLQETNVPEPGSLVALGSGLFGLAGFAIRRRRS